MTSHSELGGIIFGAISERSVKACMRAPMPPAIPRGKQNYVFKVGKTYYASECSPIKAGTPIKIASRYKQHGFAYYVDDRGLVHRQKDLKESQ